jgi:YHS domain-containing protein
VRLLLLIAIVYLGYRIVRSWVVRNLQTLGRSDAPHPEIDDVMVQDPICGIYFPRREGVALQRDGQTHLFCSTACRDRFIAQRD